MVGTTCPKAKPTPSLQLKKGSTHSLRPVLFNHFLRFGPAPGAPHLVPVLVQQGARVHVLGAAIPVGCQRSMHTGRFLSAIANTQPPSPPRNNWPEILGKYSL